MNTFLYTKPNALKEDLCRGFIEVFESSEERQNAGRVHRSSSKEDGEVKKSTDISFSPKDLQDEKWGYLLQNLVNTVESGISDYFIRFQVGLENLDPFRMSTVFNMQKYKPSEGFYGYHSERGKDEYSNRVLVWMIYLNDVTDRGETEFHYQHHFERAEQGKLVIWPADWTYTHRGIPSPTQTKYILTGWFVHYNEEIKQQ
jgi:hypothetical protein